MNTWRYIEDREVGAHEGLAVDEYMVDQCGQFADKSQTILRLYTYQDTCALVGRYQDIRAELDLDACKKLSVQYGRRLTGGGAIVMGSGQLGVCVAVSPSLVQTSVRALYKQYSLPLIRALAQLGISAQLRAKNDLEVNGKKIAGLGVYISETGAMQFHASILLDLDVANMLRVLRIPVQKLSDKSRIHSVEQRITTIKREINRTVSLKELMGLIKSCYESEFDTHMQQNPLTAQEKKEVRRIIQERYNNENWIFQRSPQPDMTGMGLKKTPAGLIRVYVALKGETIKSVLITGDFFQHGELFNQIEANLKWCPIDEREISQKVESIFTNYGKVPSGLQAAHITDSILLATRRGQSYNRLIHYQGSCYYPELTEKKKKTI